LDWFRLCLLLVLVYFCYSFYNVQGQLSAIEKETLTSQRQLDEARQKNAALLQERDRLNDRRYIEKIAREDLGLVRPGEAPVITTGNAAGRP